VKATVQVPRALALDKLEQQLDQFFRSLFAREADAIIDQTVKLYEQEMAARKLAKAGTRTILVDFDGTLCTQSAHVDDPARVAGAPMRGAFSFLESLLGAGWRVVIFTARMSSDVDKVEKALRGWFLEEGFPPAALDDSNSQRRKCRRPFT
jgi:phosphoglycolate phosphatase-like HAD superfamily hydrolase